MSTTTQDKMKKVSQEILVDPARLKNENDIPGVLSDHRELITDENYWNVSSALYSVQDDAAKTADLYVKDLILDV